MTAQVLPLRFYSTRNGLPSNNITALCQDSLGDIWIGTNDGVTMFDGREFLPYGVREGLSYPRVNDIVVDRSTRRSVWVGTGDGLCHCENGRISLVFGPPLHPRSDINAVCHDHAGRLWFAVNDTLMLFESGTARTVSLPVPLVGTGQIIETGDSLLWISHARGILRCSLRSGEWTVVSTGPHREHGKRCMNVDSNGDLWIHRLNNEGTASMLLRVRGTTIIERRRLKPTPGMAFIVDDRYGSLLANSRQGIERIEIADSHAVFHPYITTENGLLENYVRAALIDREGNLWVGGNSRGVAKLSDWSVVRIPLSGLESPYRSTIAATDLRDHLWVIADGRVREVFREPKGRWRLVSHALYQTAVALKVDQHGSLWLALQDGTLARYTIPPKKEGGSSLVQTARFVPGRDFPGGFPITFVIDSLNRVWYSMGGKGLLLLNPAAKRPLVSLFGTNRGIPENYIRTLLSDSQGRIWCGSYQDGLSYLSRDNPASATPVAFAADTRIRSILEDQSGRIWVGTRSGGLGVFDGKTWQIVTVREGLPSNTIWDMVQDATGRVWLGTGSGTVRVDSLSPLRLYRRGVLSGDASFGVGRFHSGMLWFLSADGITIFDPLRERRGAPPPRVHLTNLQVNGLSVDFVDGISLPSDRNTCTIEFVSPSFVDETGVLYRYRMLPHDTSWQGPTALPRVTYGSLPAGEHRFEVEAIDATGRQGEEPARLSITVIPPLWRRGWFVALCLGIGVVGLAGSIRALEIRRFRARMRLLEQEQALERERLRIARDMHDQIGSTLTEIAILSELARQPELEEAVASRHLSAIAGKSREVLDNISEIIWAINPRNDLLDNLAAYIRNFALRYAETAGIQCDLDVQDPMPTTHLSAEQRRNIFLIVKEGVNNVVKHAGATRIVLRLHAADSHLNLSIADNGKGFEAGTPRLTGTGLSSMKQRAEDIGGTLKIESGFGQGTTVYLILGIAQSPEKK